MLLGGWLVLEMTSETKRAKPALWSPGERKDPALAAQRGTAELGASLKTLWL